MTVEKLYNYIYKTMCLVNNKFYIGMHSTNNLDDGYMGSGLRLKRSIIKHGLENHKKEILEFLPDRKSLMEREREIVNEALIENPECMNIVYGGGGGHISKDGYKKGAKRMNEIMWIRYSEDLEYRQKRKDISSKVLREAHRMGKIKYDTFTGKKHTDETKIKIGEMNSILQSGEKNSQYGTCWITNGYENKKIPKGSSIPDGWKLGRKIKKSVSNDTDCIAFKAEEENRTPV